MGQVVLDDDQQARGVAVEPVDDPRPVLAGDGRERVVVELEGVDQRAGPVPLGRVGDHAGRLVDDGERLVLVDDLDRDVLGRRASCRAARGARRGSGRPSRTLYDALTGWPLTSTASASMTFWITLRE